MANNKGTGSFRTKNVLVNMGTGVMAKILKLFLNFVLKAVFVKVLGIQYIGVSSLFTDVLTILSFAELGIGSAITYALYKPVAEADDKKIAKLMNFYKTAYRAVAAVVFAVGLLLIPFMDVLVTNVPDIKEDITFIYFLYLINTASSYLLIYKSAIIEAKQKKYIISKIEGIMIIVRLVAECSIILAARQFVPYLILEIALTLVQNILIAKEADKEYIAEKKEFLSKEEKKVLFADIGALAMYQVSGVVLSGTDSVVISAMLGTSLVGYLSYYKLIVNGIVSFLQQFFTSANASVGNLAVEKDSERQYRLFSDINFAVFWLMTICCSCMFMLFRPFIEIWLGREYVLDDWVTAALILDFFFANMIRCVALFRTANGLFVQGKYRPVIMAVLNIGFSITLASKWGMFGVLIATVISRILAQTWYDPWLIYKKVFQKNVWDYYKKILLYIFTIVGSVFILKRIAVRIVIENPFVNFLFLVVISLIVSNALVIIFWNRTKEYRACWKRILSIVEMVIHRRK